MAEPTDGKLKKKKIGDNKMDQPWWQIDWKRENGIKSDVFFKL